jgi:hypothetical protein
MLDASAARAFTAYIAAGAVLETFRVNEMTPEELNSLAWDFGRNALIVGVMCAFILKVDWWPTSSAKRLGPRINYLIGHPLLQFALLYLWLFFCDAVTRDFFPGWEPHGSHSIVYPYVHTLIIAGLLTILLHVLWRKMGAANSDSRTDAANVPPSPTHRP